MIKELEQPYRNLPRAIFLAIFAVTVVYVLVNFSYLSVLGPDAVASSNSVALVCMTNDLH